MVMLRNMNDKQYEYEKSENSNVAIQKSGLSDYPCIALKIIEFGSWGLWSPSKYELKLLIVWETIRIIVWSDRQVIGHRIKKGENILKTLKGEANLYTPSIQRIMINSERWWYA